MRRILATLHIAMVCTVLMPVYSGAYTDMCHVLSVPVPWRTVATQRLPLEETLRALNNRFWLGSVAAAGLAAFLALLNLPMILMLKGEAGARWRAFSSLILGFLSTTLMFQLLLRYGYGREWGGLVICFDSLLLLIAGTAATARLRPGRDWAPPVVDS